ncbi:MAG: hypothetical protein IIY08_00730 [Cellulosilyticum sp.]|nr:hypothetical protein [Cellulosilyticum sp.]
MKKNLISALLALSIVIQGNAIWAEETNTSKDESSSIEANQENQEDTTITMEAPESVNSPSAYIVSGDKFTLTIGSKSYKKNDNIHTLTAAPISVEGKNYLPLRFVVDQILEGELEIHQDTATAVIKAQNNILQVTTWSKKAYLNGNAINLSNSPIVKNGTTYVPVTVLKDYFGLTVTYRNKKLTIVGKDKGVNNKPIAEFDFGQRSYVEGQKITSTSTSYDPDNHKLKDKQWCVIQNEQVVTSKELINIFKMPKAGKYRIGLKVQDQYGLWSDWTYREIEILRNEAPSIEYFGTPKKSYGQGENIEYQFYYTNEEWEKVTNEKWTYRRADEDISKAILGKPTELFKEGEYIITLELDDAYGNRSQVCETTVQITDEVWDKELSFRFKNGKIGDIIDNYDDFNYRDYADAVVSSTGTVPGTMIMSDSPEDVTREGILYRDSINGVGRLLLHHINKFEDTYGTKRLVIIAENKTAQTVQATLGNKTIRGPVTDVLHLGQRVLYDYLSGSQNETIKLKPGEKKYIYDSGSKWQPEMCISGLMDVKTTGPVTFTVAAVSSGSTLHNMLDMEYFYPTVHPRGTFKGIGKTYNLTLDGSQPTKLVLGNGQEEWVKGYDAFTGSEAYNKGNYGISYYITITATEDTGIILNPRADIFRGAVKWKGEGVYNTPRIGSIISNTSKAVSLGTIKAGETKTLEYMLPNGSSAPVVLAFIPKSYWEN